MWLATSIPVPTLREILRWFTAGALDGFNSIPAIKPTGLIDVVDDVVPLLQDKAIYKRDDTATGVPSGVG